MTEQPSEPAVRSPEDETDERPSRDRETPVPQPEPTEDEVEADQAAEEAQARRKRRPFVFITGAAIVAILAVGIVYYWLTTQNLEWTDDAYTDGRVVTIAPQVDGQVDSLDVTDNEFLRQGQPIIHIFPGRYINDRDLAEGQLATAKAQLAGQQYGAEIARKNFPALLKQAQAQLASAQALEVKTQADYQRQRSLPKQATTQQDIDAALSAWRQAQAQVQQAEAQVLQAEPVPQRIGEADAQVGQLRGEAEQAQARLNQANLNLSWTVVKAPQDGWVTKRNVEKGNYVTAGQQIMSLVSPEVWVTANFKETQLHRMRPGQSVDISVDAYPQLKLKGHVDSIQMGSGTKFTAFPPENATGNFIKIVQRVPVKIVIDSGLDPEIPLPLGISVVPTVNLK